MNESDARSRDAQLRRHCGRLCQKTKVPVSKVFIAFEFWELPASKGSTTSLIWLLLCAMSPSPSSLSSMSKGYGLRPKLASKWMRFHEMTRSALMQSCNPMS
jgi:hypothetical protein